MFPQLIAGPIVRYGTIAKEIHTRKVRWEDFSEGGFRFLVGLGKKVILANQLSEVADQFLAGNLAELSTAIQASGLSIAAIARGTRCHWETVYHAAHNVPVRFDSARRIMYYLRTLEL